MISSATVPQGLPTRVFQLFGVAVAGMALTGCAASVAKNMCLKSGWAEGSNEHQACANNIRQQWKTEARRDLAEALTLGVALAGAAGEAAYSAPASIIPPGSPNRLQREWLDPKGRLCGYEDGTVLNIGSGSCPASFAAAR